MYLQDLFNEAANGTLPMQYLGLVSGAYMIITGILGMVTGIVSFNIIKTVLDLYIGLFGIATVILEVKFQKAEDWRKKIYIYFKALSFVWGRGSFHVFCGVVLLSAGGLLNYIGGPLIIALGCYMLYNGYKSFGTLQQANKGTKNEKEAAENFRRYDTEHREELDSRQFGLLLKDMGMSVTHPQLEALVMMLDTDRSGTISMQEYLTWYMETDGV